MGNDAPQITFDSSATGTMLEVFDFSVDENGIVFDQENVACRDDMGLIHEEEVGGIVPDINGNPTILRDNFCKIVDYYTWQNNTDIDYSDTVWEKIEGFIKDTLEKYTDVNIQNPTFDRGRRDFGGSGRRVY